MKQESPGQSRYLVDAVMRACDILDAFEPEGELLRLTEIASRTGISKATVFRLLVTLEHRGMVERVGGYDFRLAVRRLRRHRYRIGFGAQSSEFAFSRAVSDSIESAAKQEGFELVVLNNRYSKRTALRNVDQFIRHKMDLVVEFQTDEQAAPLVAAKLVEASIPLIAVEIPHPNATYYGADNYRAGVIGGRYLASTVKSRWNRVDEFVLLELPQAGPLPRSRLMGMVAGVKQVLDGFDEASVVYLNGNGQFGRALEVTRRHLRRTRAKHILVGAINDPSALGALRAFEEAGRAADCAVVGQNASLEARAEMRLPGTRFVGSVGYFPERYGERVLLLATDILERRPVPPAVFVKHQMITPANVDRFYPNDVLLTRSGLDMILMNSGGKIPQS
jgi:ribose transport system substrate-binding protein